MAILRICKYGEPILRRKCKPVESITPEVRKLAKDMVETMKVASGVGLAACQVGVDARLCIIDTNPSAKSIPLVLINPKIVKKSGRVHEEEGCLSFPGIAAKIKRCRKVKVNALNEYGMPFVVEGEGLLSRALQHEIDHLNGKVFISRLPLLEKLKAQHQIRKKKKEGTW